MNKENQTISTITSDRDGNGGAGGGRHPGNNAVVQQQPPPPMYDRDRLTQVKTYTDHGNGYGQRSGGTTHYSKVRNYIELAKLIFFLFSYIGCKITVLMAALVLFSLNFSHYFSLSLDEIAFILV